MLLLSLWCRLNTNLSFDCVKLKRHIASAVNVVLSNHRVGPLPRIKTSFSLLSVCTDELISAPKLRTFFPMLPPVNKKSEREPSPMP